MSQRKTVQVAQITRQVNQMIAAPNSTKDGRVALGVFLASLLLETGNYRGFNYTHWSTGGGYVDWLTDGQPTDTTPYLGDQTRVEYY
jgi:hypothetical protein